MSNEGKDLPRIAGKSQRKKEMKILVMGMGRTGTRALATGLKQQGFTPYHYVDRFFEGHLGLWNQAMKAKFHGVGKPWGRREFDEVTSDFDVILDVPCCLFAAELCEAYPEAKVILNWRDPDEWVKSLNSTLFQVFQWPSLRVLRYTDPKICGIWCQHNDLIWDYFCDRDYSNEAKIKDRFRKHYEFVRQIVPRERLLEYDIKQGWTPVTAFLDLPEFTGTVERNYSAAFIDDHTRVWKWHIRNSLRNLGRAGILLCVLITSWIYSRAYVKGCWRSILQVIKGNWRTISQIVQDVSRQAY